MGPILGLSGAELQRLGIADLMLATTSAGWTPDAQSKAASQIRYWRDISTATEMVLGNEVSPHGAVFGNRYSVPGDLFRRTLSGTGGSAGGYLVDTDVAGFVATKRNRSVISRLPVVRRDGLKADATFGRGSASATASWQAVATDEVTPSGITLGQLSAQPHALSCIIEFSSLLVKQMGAAANAFVLDEIAAAVDEQLDVAFLNGSGAEGQPLGILNSEGIGTQAGNALAWSTGVLEMLKTAESYSEGGSLVWVLDPASAKILRGRESAQAGSGSGFIMAGGEIGGYPALVTNSCPAGTMVLAPWSDITVCTWGAPVLDVTPFSSATNFRTGIIAARLTVEVDFIVGKPSTVIVATSIT